MAGLPTTPQNKRSKVTTLGQGSSTPKGKETQNYAKFSCNGQNIAAHPQSKGPRTDLTHMATRSFKGRGRSRPQGLRKSATKTYVGPEFLCSATLGAHTQKTSRSPVGNLLPTALCTGCLMGSPLHRSSQPKPKIRGRVVTRGDQFTLSRESPTSDAPLKSF